MGLLQVHQQEDNSKYIEDTYQIRILDTVTKVLVVLPLHNVCSISSMHTRVQEIAPLFYAHFDFPYAVIIMGDGYMDCWTPSAQLRPKHALRPGEYTRLKTWSMPNNKGNDDD